jgi:glucosamine 6-phosphate synthetase-like amidotransferase/phosphosugar isomerase protein
MNVTAVIAAMAATLLTFGIFLVAVGVAITARLESDRRHYIQELNRAFNQIEDLKSPEQRTREARHRQQVEERNRAILLGDGV